MDQPIHINKLVFGGQGLGHTPDGQTILVWNALPGEDVDVDIIKKRQGIIEATATNIRHPSPDRITPPESHWLSSAPWEMMSWERENYWKRAIAAETYSKIGDLIIQESNLEIVADAAQQYGYRNKIEFSFTLLNDGTISLAFFARGQRCHIPATGSLLANPQINDTAQTILAWINTEHIPLRSLKALIIRSDQSHHTIAALFIKDELSFATYPQLTDTVVGFHIFYSTHKSPASVPTKKIYSTGQDYLIAELKHTKLKFGMLSFFQINLPIFDQALDDIAAWLHPKIPLIDYFSGVGTIGLALSHHREHTVLVDSNPDAIFYAQENMALNYRQNCEAHCLPAEKMLQIIDNTQMIIVDPPRAGLHERLIRRLLIKKPLRIIYLSCDLATHARDLKLLSSEYKISFLRLYNFFPRTPHIEGLCVLDRIQH